MVWGCAAAHISVAAGVGELTLLDFDKVSLSNLQRQILHTDQRIDMPKVESAKWHFPQINPLIKINAINQK